MNFLIKRCKMSERGVIDHEITMEKEKGFVFLNPIPLYLHSKKLKALISFKLRSGSSVG